MRATRLAAVGGFGVLLACSGGDGTDLDGSTDDAATNDATPPIDASTKDVTNNNDAAPPVDAGPDVTVTPPGPVYGAKCTGTDTNESLATDEVAIVRGKAKLPALNCVTTAMQAAHDHSSY